jgi:hypothetical protein
MAILRDTTIECSLIVNNNLSIGSFTLKRRCRSISYE